MVGRIEDGVALPHRASPWHFQTHLSPLGAEGIPRAFPRQGKTMRMKTTAIFFLFLGLLWLAGCGNEDPAEREPRSLPVTPSNIEDGFLHIIFKWPGDDFASRQALEIRDQIARAIEERRIGMVTRVGTGMGSMEIVVKVEEREAARSEIEKIIREIAPDMNSTIR